MTALKEEMAVVQKKHAETVSQMLAEKVAALAHKDEVGVTTARKLFCKCLLYWLEIFGTGVVVDDDIVRQ